MASPLREAAFQLGQEMSRSRRVETRWEGGPKETRLLSLFHGLAGVWGPGRTGWCPEAGSHLQVGATGGAGAAGLAPSLSFLTENGGSLCPLPRAQRAGLQI